MAKVKKTEDSEKMEGLTIMFPVSLKEKLRLQAVGEDRTMGGVARRVLTEFFSDDKK